MADGFLYKWSWEYFGKRFSRYKIVATQCCLKLLIKCLLLPKDFSFCYHFFLLCKFFSNPDSHTQDPVLIYFIQYFIEVILQAFFPLFIYRLFSYHLDGNQNGVFN